MIQEVVDPKKLEEFLRRSNLHYKTSNKSYIFDCPICKKKQKLYMLRDCGQFVCWTCKDNNGFAGRPEKALSKMLGLPYNTVKAAICMGGSTSAEVSQQVSSGLMMDFNLSTSDKEDTEVDTSKWPDLVWPLHCHEIDSESGRAGAVYLASRGIPVDVAKEYDIRYNIDDMTVDFPILVGSRLVGWQSRKTANLTYVVNDIMGSTVKKAPKILSTPDIPRDKVLMFQNRVTGKKAVIAEGPVDAIKCHLFGGNVATMGKAVSDGQLQVLYQKGVEEVYLALDPDAASGIDALIARIRKMGMTTYLVPIPDKYKDIGEMSFEAAFTAIQAADEIRPYEKLHMFFG